MPSVPSLQLRVGGTYRDRTGRRWTVIEHRPRTTAIVLPRTQSRDFPFLMALVDGDGRSPEARQWVTSDGRLFLARPSDLDLVEEA